MLGGWKVEGVSELSDLILQSVQAPGIDSGKVSLLKRSACIPGNVYPIALMRVADASTSSCTPCTSTSPSGAAVGDPPPPITSST